MPPEVVRMRASSTVFVKASSRVNLDFAGIVVGGCGYPRGASCGNRFGAIDVQLEESTDGFGEALG